MLFFVPLFVHWNFSSSHICPSLPFLSLVSSVRILLQVPVHTQPEREDLTIRAYRACPAFHADLTDLYASKAFHAEEAAHLELLQRLAERFPDHAVLDAEEGVSYVPLERLWTVYDALAVAAEAEGSGVDPQLEALASWVEHQRFGAAVAGPRLGANLWEEMLGRAEAAAAAYGLGTTATEASAAHPPHRLVVFSGHYPTLLSLLASLRLLDANPALLADGRELPGYAAALIAELWQEDGGSSAPFLRLRYRHGPDVLVQDALYLELGPACDAAAAAASLPAGSCPLSALRAAAESIPGWPASLADWCDACGNEDAAACVAATAASTGNTAGWSWLVLAASAGLAVGVAAGAAVAVCVVRRQRRLHLGPEDEAAAIRDTGLELSAPVAPSSTPSKV